MLVPAGFEAYVRIFHPMYRSDPSARPINDEEIPLGSDATDNSAEPAEDPDLPAWHDVTWAAVAADFGTTMHPLAQSRRLMGFDDPYVGDDPVGPSGRTYLGPTVGSLDQIDKVARVLARYTTTPAAGVAAIWEGWGGLVSSAGRWSITFRATDNRLAGIGLKLEAAFRRFWMHFQASPKPGTGLLSREVAVGPRLELLEPGCCESAAERGPSHRIRASRPARPEPPAGCGSECEPAADPTGTDPRPPFRAYILFRAGASEFATDDWQQTAPWVDPPLVQTPSILWPDDHAWVLATEIDDDSTIVAGSHELADALLTSPDIEALEVLWNDDLAWSGD
jgi:hypothetical protein